MSREDFYWKLTYAYIHIALPCSSWSPAQRVSEGSRRKENPDGTGGCLKEPGANAPACFVAQAAARQAMTGGLFIIENPDQS